MSDVCSFDVRKLDIDVERGTISFHGYLLRLTRGWRARRSHSMSDDTRAGGLRV
jgi:hypothetical protein